MIELCALVRESFAVQRTASSVVGTDCTFVVTSINFCGTRTVQPTLGRELRSIHCNVNTPGFAFLSSPTRVFPHLDHKSTQFLELEIKDEKVVVSSDLLRTTALNQLSRIVAA